jgi:glyoxylate utilization-related uncharacterized protein
VDAAELRDLVEFEEGSVVRRTVFESDRMWVQLLCLDRNGSYGPLADALLTIVAGEAVFLVDKSRRRLKQWGAVMVPRGSQLVIRNASPEPLVVLMAAAPPPAERPVTG